MSLVTLNKYLSDKRHPSPGSVNEPNSASGIYLDMLSRTLAGIRGDVLCGEPFADLFEEVDRIRKDLHVETSSDVVSGCAARVEKVLVTYRDRFRDMDCERAADLAKVIEMLNETLRYFAAGQEKTEVQNKQLEANLLAATRIDDISALRAYLTKILQSVREGNRGERDQAQTVIELLGRQMQQVHKVHAKFDVDMQGRAQAMEYLKHLRLNSDARLNLHIALFVVDSLQAIRERHSADVAQTILKELGRKEVKALAPEGQVFGWSANALVLIWNHIDITRAASDISFRLPNPCEQRVFLGARVAIFNLKLRSLVAQAGSDSPAEIEAKLDRFIRRGGEQ